ncbi:hypothetical protein [Sphingomicrobium arenosum]|uniref:hypothetical protein n=1 Tax=Sphingomicrobium arenosum TaxID=2233861 RepID=UPI00223FC757|nr:hypothetical protein [Sphingomicrobium arenosum]
MKRHAVLAILAPPAALLLAACQQDEPAAEASLEESAPTMPASAERIADLVGARGGQAEAQIMARGFTLAEDAGYKTADASHSFWWHAGDGGCVQVVTREGRYAEILDADPAVCRGEAPATRPAATRISETLAPFGDGYPNAGDPCRRLGEAPATAEWLDDAATLVGCPTQAAADRLGGEVVETVEGTVVVSVPLSTAERAAEMAPFVEEMPDPADPDTGYNATAPVRCGFANAAPNRECNAGVKRRWGDDGTTLVEVTKPDGRTRAIFFRGTTPYGADSAQADGSAGWDFDVERKGDTNVIRYGPETYVIVDAFVVGG